MTINDGYNQSLLEIIARRKVITFDDLVKEYLAKIKQRLVIVNAVEAKLISDLAILEEEQFIRINDQNIIYVGS